MTKIKIEQNGFTRLYADGEELRNVQSFNLHQAAGEIPVLDVTLWPVDMHVELSGKLTRREYRPVLCCQDCRFREYHKCDDGGITNVCTRRAPNGPGYFQVSVDDFCSFAEPV